MSCAVNKGPTLSYHGMLRLMLKQMDVEKKYIANYDKYIAGNENSWCLF